MTDFSSVSLDDMIAMVRSDTPDDLMARSDGWNRLHDTLSAQRSALMAQRDELEPGWQSPAGQAVGQRIDRTLTMLDQQMSIARENGSAWAAIAAASQRAHTEAARLEGTVEGQVQTQTATAAAEAQRTAPPNTTASPPDGNLIRSSVKEGVANQLRPVMTETAAVYRESLARIKPLAAPPRRIPVPSDSAATGSAGSSTTTPAVAEQLADGPVGAAPVTPPTTTPSASPVATTTSSSTAPAGGSTSADAGIPALAPGSSTTSTNPLTSVTAPGTSGAPFTPTTGGGGSTGSNPGVIGRPATGSPALAAGSGEVSTVVGPAGVITTPGRSAVPTPLLGSGRAPAAVTGDSAAGGGQTSVIGGTPVPLPSVARTLTPGAPISGAPPALTESAVPVPRPATGTAPVGGVSPVTPVVARPTPSPRPATGLAPTPGAGSVSEPTRVPRPATGPAPTTGAGVRSVSEPTPVPRPATGTAPTTGAGVRSVSEPTPVPRPAVGTVPGAGAGPTAAGARGAPSTRVTTPFPGAEPEPVAGSRLPGSGVSEPGGSTAPGVSTPGVAPGAGGAGARPAPRSTSAPTTGRPLTTRRPIDVAEPVTGRAPTGVGGPRSVGTAPTGENLGPSRTTPPGEGTRPGPASETPVAGRAPGPAGTSFPPVGTGGAAPGGAAAPPRPGRPGQPGRPGRPETTTPRGTSTEPGFPGRAGAAPGRPAARTAPGTSESSTGPIVRRVSLKSPGSGPGAEPFMPGAARNGGGRDDEDGWYTDLDEDRDLWAHDEAVPPVIERAPRTLALESRR